MVLPASDRVARARPYSGTAPKREKTVGYRTLTFYGGAFQPPSPTLLFAHSLARAHAAPQPRPCRQGRFGLFPVRSPLLRKSRLISSPRGTEMFHFPRFASHLSGMTGYHPRRVSPFGHPRLIARLAAPRGFSQLATPFLACPRLGIPRMP